MPGPISPVEAKNKKGNNIPEVVFNAFNSLIIKNLIRGSAKIIQNDVVDLICLEVNPETSKNFTSKEIFDNHWLDIEEHYEKAGWKVKYNKPFFDESFDAFFIFQEPNKYL